MMKVNLNNGNEKKFDIIPWDTLKPDAIPFLQKKLKRFNDFPITKIL